jgi:hypothetical protein
LRFREERKVQLIKQSKQLRYYYRHREERLDYQKQYYQRHKQSILTNNKQRYLTNKVKRINKYNSLLYEISVKAFSELSKHARPHDLFMKAFNHYHGRHRGKRIYGKKRRGKLSFHLIPELSFQIEPKVEVVVNYPKSKQLTTARQLSIETCHFLGLKYGTSIVWKEKHPHSGRIQTHTLCFDGSGLDISHLSNQYNDLGKLVEHRLETGLKGLDLLLSFALKYSLNNYIRVWLGSHALITDNPESALNAYNRDFPLCKT